MHDEYDYDYEAAQQVPRAAERKPKSNAMMFCIIGTVGVVVLGVIVTVLLLTLGKDDEAAPSKKFSGNVRLSTDYAEFKKDLEGNKAAFAKGMSSHLQLTDKESLKVDNTWKSSTGIAFTVITPAEERAAAVQERFVQSTQKAVEAGKTGKSADDAFVKMLLEHLGPDLMKDVKVMGGRVVGQTNAEGQPLPAKEIGDAGAENPQPLAAAGASDEEAAKEDPALAEQRKLNELYGRVAAGDAGARAELDALLAAKPEEDANRKKFAALLAKLDEQAADSDVDQDDVEDVEDAAAL